MKCPQCGADTSVLATRKHKTVFLKRTRQCFNEHRFMSIEVPMTSLMPSIRAEQVRKAVHALAALEKSDAEIAAELGISQNHTARLRKAACA